MGNSVDQVTSPPAFFLRSNDTVRLKHKVSEKMCEIEDQAEIESRMYHIVQYLIIARLCAIAKTLPNELFHDQDGIFYLPKETTSEIPRRCRPVDFQGLSRIVYAVLDQVHCDRLPLLRCRSTQERVVQSVN